MLAFGKRCPGLAGPTTVSLTARALLLGFALTLTSLAGTGTASAQYIGRSPWCAQVHGAALECYYQTFEQCFARASGISNVCMVNPYYVPPPLRGAPRRRGRGDRS